MWFVKKYIQPMEDTKRMRDKKAAIARGEFPKDEEEHLKWMGLDR